MKAMTKKRPVGKPPKYPISQIKVGETVLMRFERDEWFNAVNYRSMQAVISRHRGRGMDLRIQVTVDGYLVTRLA